MLSLHTLLVVNGLLTVNGGKLRVGRQAPAVNCQGLKTNGYSEFNIEEEVSVAPDGRPAKDGKVLSYHLYLEP